MSRRRADRWEDEDDRGRPRRDDYDDYDERDRRDRRRYDEDDRDRRYDDEDDRPRRRSYDDRDDRERRRRDDDRDDRERRRRPERRSEDDFYADGQPRRKKKKERSSLAIVLVLVSLLVLSLTTFLVYYFVFSGAGDRSKLIGTWTGTLNDTPVVYAFHDDMTFDLQGGGKRITGKWMVRRSFGGTDIHLVHDQEIIFSNRTRLAHTEDWDIVFLSDDEIRIVDRSWGVTFSTFKRQKSFPTSPFRR